MPLKLTLKPEEKVVINGAVLSNGPSKTTLSIENSAIILRQKDIMQEEEANTPARRIYFCIQMAYLDLENTNLYLEKTNQLVRDFMAAIPTEAVKKIIEPLGAELAGGRYFQALKRCRELIAFEEQRLNYGFESVR
ncbi:MAG: flagellar biosynthesis repressor FlbT [Alphaproteobacteria bacterium]|jgi:flagellar protein FlbT|nr:flagellar biosynthesis repressor FlbT [Alphaproteobacteria bacterium]MDP6515841.1 flagellar biosynthesis repressor FlbT [Alphaproteobacteria bacterium]|tara:strand:+ start:551 stop:958 length:408 start_codon:yes stop_codon:yes gene_type:complete